MSVNLEREEALSSALAGVLGTLVFGGFFMAINNTGVIKGAIPALYGLGPSMAVGWAIHLVHGAILGVIYALIINNTSYSDHLDDVVKSSGWGAVYGGLTAVLLAAVLMPIWLSTVGFPNAPSTPNFSPMGILGHVLYGVVLGASYPVIRDQLE